MAQLADKLNSPRAVEAYLSNAWGAGQPEPEEDDDDAPAPAPVAPPADAAQAALEALRRALGQTSAPLDETRVVELIREHATQRVVHVIQATTPAGEPVAIEGAHPALPRIVRALQARVHVFLAGPAGCGKTHIGEEASKVLGLSFFSTGAVDSPYALTGFRSAAGEYQRTPFRDAFERGGVFLFDEIDASDASALLVVNQALANGSMAFPDGMIRRHPDFCCIAAANTFGHGADRLYVGRAQLDAATLDRFARIGIDYDSELERRLAGNDAWVARVQAIRAEARVMKARVVVSMRAGINGARLLAAGWSVAEVEDAMIFSGHDKPTVTRLRAAGDRA
jgi:cobaltochelatase CobS